MVNDMSLTSLLSTKEGRAVLKPLEFKSHKLSTEMSAPPLTKNYKGVGTAFDYLARWHLEHRYSDKIAPREEWIADAGVELARNTYRLKAGNEPDFNQTDTISGAGVPPDTPVHVLERAWRDASRILDGAKSGYRQYLETGIADAQTAAAALSLVDLDAIFRTGDLTYFLRTKGGTKPDAHDITDVLNLHGALTESSTLHQELGRANSISLNPDFDKTGQLVGGADADIIADDMLIDIKTTKFPKFERKYWEQLCGYCALASLQGMSIRRVAIYFSRFGVLEIVRLPDADWPSIGKQLQTAFVDLWVKAIQR